MTSIQRSLSNFLRNEHGFGAMEYAMALGLIAVVAVAAVLWLGANTSVQMGGTADYIAAAGTAGGGESYAAMTDEARRAAAEALTGSRPVAARAPAGGSGSNSTPASNGADAYGNQEGSNNGGSGSSGNGGGNDYGGGNAGGNGNADQGGNSSENNNNGNNGNGGDGNNSDNGNGSNNSGGGSSGGGSGSSGGGGFWGALLGWLGFI